MCWSPCPSESLPETSGVEAHRCGGVSERGTHIRPDHWRRLVVLYRFLCPTMKVLIWCPLTRKVERSCERRSDRNYFVLQYDLSGCRGRLSGIPWLRTVVRVPKPSSRKGSSLKSTLGLGPDVELTSEYSLWLRYWVESRWPKVWVPLTLYCFHVTKVDDTNTS